MTITKRSNRKSKRTSAAAILKKYMKKYGVPVESDRTVDEAQLQALFKTLLDGDVVNHVLKRSFFRDMAVLYEFAQKRGIKLAERHNHWEYEYLMTSFTACKMYLYEACLRFWIFKHPHNDLSAFQGVLRRANSWHLDRLIDRYADSDDRTNLIDDYDDCRKQTKYLWENDDH